MSFSKKYFNHFYLSKFSFIFYKSFTTFENYFFVNTTKQYFPIRFSTIEELKQVKSTLRNSTLSQQNVMITTSKISDFIQTAVMLHPVPSEYKTSNELLQALPASLKDKVDWIHIDLSHQAAFVWLTGRISL